MAERTPQQLERDLDIFWNALVPGRRPCPRRRKRPGGPVGDVWRRTSAASGFLDALWTQLLVPETNGHLDEHTPARRR